MYFFPERLPGNTRSKYSCAASRVECSSGRHRIGRCRHLAPRVMYLRAEPASTLQEIASAFRRLIKKLEFNEI